MQGAKTFLQGAKTIILYIIRIWKMISRHIDRLIRSLSNHFCNNFCISESFGGSQSNAGEGHK